ncbi:Arylsulfatase [Tolypocladium ophioglossoides CBS 100239]|uniref:Arylsulfatase n=1 Tax=Tolypocladium ophioglossoides (strain CBS 100239) TaxID=1163406 RepID=A0A0L0NE35_TOLOC|nr:Arylsulfatase [Tolypocladium ophioglossoides CBS 100239]
MSGYNTTLYREHPKAWHKVDLLLDPWTHDYNTPVFSKNGMTPVVYHGYHQTDVIRAKALDRLLSLTTEQKHKPFYLTIAPVAPHVEFGGLPKPQVRHKHAFPEAKAPQHANFNPTVSFAQQKPSWLKGLKPLNDSEIDHVNMHFRHRIQALQGVDEIVHDVVKLLEENGALDNTYIIYTTDNGYHLGQHRVMAGNTLPYLEDTNLPFIVRGPGVPGGEISRLPGAHLDLAPTFLDIACVHPHNVPVYFDGRSLLDNWHKPLRFPSGSESANRDIINGEFWGRSVVEAPGYEGSINNSYKTIRIVGRETAWLYSKWCTGDTELYESFFDIFELENLVEKAAPGSVQARIMHRLDALLMLTKTCSQDFCRDPWAMLQSTCFLDNSCPHSRIFNSIGSAMDPRFDDFFAKLPKVQMADCLEYQDVRNGSSSSLGSKPTNNYKSPTRPSRPVPGNALDQGTLSQRHTQISEMEEKARKLTDAELGIFSS